MAHLQILEAAEAIKERNVLPSGDTLKYGSNSYSILKLLGSGKYGDVYSVLRESDMKPFAAKVETRTSSTFRLNAECAVFEDIRNTEPKKKTHFLECADRGKTESFNYIVMSISGYSLDMIVKALLPNKLESEIKPNNFTVGIGDKVKTLFLIDFGASRRYVERNGQLRLPRPRIPRSDLVFTGTVKYASRRSHAHLELCRADDLEMWIFMIYELFNKDNPFWRRVVDMSKVAEKKQKFFTTTIDSEKVDPTPLKAPAAFLEVISHIDSLTFSETPDYDLILGCIHGAARKNQINLDKLEFEWQDAKVIEKLEADGEELTVEIEKTQRDAKGKKCDDGAKQATSPTRENMSPTPTSPASSPRADSREELKKNSVVTSGGNKEKEKKTPDSMKEKSSGKGESEKVGGSEQKANKWAGVHRMVKESPDEKFENDENAVPALTFIEQHELKWKQDTNTKLTKSVAPSQKKRNALRSLFLNICKEHSPTEHTQEIEKTQGVERKMIDEGVKQATAPTPDAGKEKSSGKGESEKVGGSEPKDNKWAGVHRMAKESHDEEFETEENAVPTLTSIEQHELKWKEVAVDDNAEIDTSSKEFQKAHWFMQILKRNNYLENVLGAAQNRVLHECFVRGMSDPTKEELALLVRAMDSVLDTVIDREADLDDVIDKDIRNLILQRDVCKQQMLDVLLVDASLLPLSWGGAVVKLDANRLGVACRGKEQAKRYSFHSTPVATAQSPSPSTPVFTPGGSNNVAGGTESSNATTPASTPGGSNTLAKQELVQSPTRPTSLYLGLSSTPGPISMYLGLPSTLASTPGGSNAVAGSTESSNAATPASTPGSSNTLAKQELVQSPPRPTSLYLGVPSTPGPTSMYLGLPSTSASTPGGSNAVAGSTGSSNAATPASTPGSSNTLAKQELV